MTSEAEYYKCVLDNLTGGFVSVDLGGKVVYVNPMAGRILRIKDPGALAGSPYPAALAAFPALCEVIRDALSTHRTVHRAEMSILHADTPLVIGYSTLQVRTPKGATLGIGIIFQDLTMVRAAKKPA